MANNKRLARVNELIRAELAKMILHELKDRRVGFVTVTGVEVTPDLRNATVLVSVMGSEKEKKSTMIALGRSSGFLQYRINDVIRLKFTPRLHFKLDESLDYSLKIDQIINKIHTEEKDQDATNE